MKVIMMDLDNNASEAIGLSFAVSAFMVSLTLSLYLFTTTGDTIQQTYEMNTNTDYNIHSTLKVSEKYFVTGTKVRQSLYQINDIGIDIEVDGLMFSKSLDPTTLTVTAISLTEKYTPTYVRDTNGVITMLRFNKE
jgi:hypothetical protein